MSLFLITSNKADTWTDTNARSLRVAQQIAARRYRGHERLYVGIDMGTQGIVVYTVKVGGHWIPARLLEVDFKMNTASLEVVRSWTEEEVAA